MNVVDRGRSVRRRRAERFLEVTLEHVRLVRAERTVLRGIDWSIRPGERWILAGGNGSGKTQLLKLVSGAVWPTPTGRERRIYHWRGEAHSVPLEVHEEIAYVGPERQDRYERYGWNHTVEQVIGTGVHRTDIPLERLADAGRRRVASLLRRLGLADLAGRRFLTLSYGERRLVLLARALAARPGLLLLDELFTGLDPQRHAQAMRWLESTGRSRLPWVLATHRRGDVPRSATHALVLDDGRIVYRGTLARAPLARWLDGAQPPARRMRPHRRARAVRPVPSGDAGFLVRLAKASVYLDERRVLQDISLRVDAGDCWVVHGANGSGKSTLLRTIYGDHGVAVGGSIERAGIVPGVPLERFKRRVGLVAPHLQADHPQHLTVAEVVQSGRHASIGLGQPASALDRAAARRALAFFGIAALAVRPLRELSYGQLRRVLFARAWVDRPALLLLDEPFAGLDAPTRHELRDHIDELVAAGTAVVMATHHRSEWPRTARCELELVRGASAYCGPVR